MTLKNNRVPILCYFKLCVSFRTHCWIQTGVTVRKRPIWVKTNDYLGRVTFKLDGWPWKTIGHLFYDTLSFVHHFNAIVKFKLTRLQCFVHHLEILQMTMKNNRAPLLCYFKLCASFRTHSSWCIQTGVTVRKRSIRIKSDDFFSRVTFKFDRWLWKTIGYLFYATSSFVYHFVPIVEFKLELQSGNAQFGSKPTIIWAVWPSNLTDDLEKQ